MTRENFDNGPDVTLIEEDHEAIYQQPDNDATFRPHPRRIRTHRRNR